VHAVESSKPDTAITLTSHPASPTSDIGSQDDLTADQIVVTPGDPSGNDLEYETDITESELALSASSSNSSLHDELRKLDDAESDGNDKVTRG